MKWAPPIVLMGMSLVAAYFGVGLSIVAGVGAIFLIIAIGMESE